MTRGADVRASAACRAGSAPPVAGTAIAKWDSLLREMLAKEPLRRPTATELIRRIVRS